MKAAILKAFGSPLSVEDWPDPVLGTGEIIVDVVAAPILSYANEVFSVPGATCSTCRSSPDAGRSAACAPSAPTRRALPPETG